MTTLNDRLIIETPENIYLEFELAGLGSRFLAYLIDTVIQLLMTFALIYILAIVFGILGSALNNVNLASSWQLALVGIIIFLIYEGYFITCETIWHGQSVGKKILKLRVVKDGGYPITFWDSVIRNILRVIDMLPPLWFIPSYGLGSAVLLSNVQSKRIGDYVAGTLVIKEKITSGFEHFSALRINPEYIRNIKIPFVHRMDGKEYYLLREFFYRKNLFPPDERQKMAQKLATQIKKTIKLDPDTYTNDQRFLDDLMLLLESKRG
ncbi:RDD family protein [bacterium]|nr:RDD family protein [bacterium]